MVAIAFYHSGDIVVGLVARARQYYWLAIYSYPANKISLSTNCCSEFGI